MNCRQVRKALEKTLNGEEPAQDLAGLQAHLDGCSQCQDWYDREQRTISILEQLEPVPAPPDFTQQVLGRLPQLPLNSLDKLVRLTRQAWKDPGFRETLRAQPRQTIEGWGLDLPPDLEIVVVPPGEATLPTQDRFTLPLPAAGEGPLQEGDLRTRSHDTEAAVWIQPELATAPVGDVVSRPGGWFEPVVERTRMVWRSLAGRGGGPTPRRLLRPALAMVATLLVLFGLLYVLAGDRGHTTPGTVAGSGPWVLGVIVFCAGVLVAVLVFWGRKK